MSNAELYRFDVIEAVNLCTDEELLSFLWHFTNKMHGSRRKRTQAEKQARAEFMGVSVEDVAD